MTLARFPLPAPVAALAAFAFAAGAAEPARLEPWSAEAETPPAAWHFAGLPRQRAPQTKFAVATVDGRRALRVEADSSYGNLVHPLPADAARPRHLAWSWKVERLNEAGDLRQRSGDDTSLKVCALFDMPLDKLSFMEQQKLRIARSLSSEPVPAATICYVWDGKLPVGTDLVNAFTSRQRYVVLKSGPAQVGQWLRERRDIEADFRRLFGAESAEMPPLAAVASGADADNTKGRSLAYVGEITLEP